VRHEAFLPKLSFEGSCARCGAAPSGDFSASSPEDYMTKPLCPQCREKMSAHEIGLQGIWSCIYCEGNWITPEQLKALLASANSQSATLTWSQARTGDSQDEQELVCPSCESRTFSRISNSSTELSCCKSCHGLFFDKGALSTLLPPGLPGTSLGALVGGAVGAEIAADAATDLVISLVAALVTGGL